MRKRDIKTVARTKQCVLMLVRIRAQAVKTSTIRLQFSVFPHHLFSLSLSLFVNIHLCSEQVFFTHIRRGAEKYSLLAVVEVQAVIFSRPAYAVIIYKVMCFNLSSVGVSCG